MAATNKRGVFSLETVLERQSDNHWSKIPEVFRYIQNVGNDYGYSLGGYYPSSGPGNGSTYVQRIDFTNDTSTGSSRGNLSSQRSAHGAASSLTAMYTANGQNYGVSPSTSIVDRLDYASDTLTATRKGDIPNSRYATSGVSNTDFGFWIGGTPGPANTFRTEWASDTASPIPSANWYPGSGSPYFGAAAGNLSYGYAFAGTPGGTHTGRIDYSNHTATMVEKGKGTYSSYGIAGTGNANYGYYAGGSGPKSSVSRLDYANDDTAATPKGPLDTAKLCAGATATPEYGYWIGGADGGWGNPGTTSSQRLDFSNDTATTSPKGPLAAGVSYNSGTSTRAFGFPTQTPAILPSTTGSPNHGYLFGGYSPSVVSTTERLDFDNDTAKTVFRGFLTVARYSHNSAAGNLSAGHMMGGYNGSSRTSIHDRMDYANDSNTMESKANMNWPTTGAGATGNKDKGYWWGGRNDSYSPNYLTFVDRVDYSNSTVTAMPPSTTQGNDRTAAGNLDYGWWMGAQQTQTLPYLRNWVYRFDYANDTEAASPKGPLMYSLYSASATGNSNFGYLAGGSPNNSYVQRVDYSNDSATALNRTNLLVTPPWISSTGNSSFGYFSVAATAQNRIDYSNDTATMVQLNNLPDSGYMKAGVSPVMNGFTGAYAPVDKGADGFQVTSIGPLGPAYGYAVGGLSHSLYQRVDYSNDTATATNQAHTTTPGTLTSSVGNNTHAYTWVSGGQGQNSSIVERYDYSADTTDSTPKGNFAETKQYLAGAAGNGDYGYFMGGRTPAGSNTSTVQRVDYSNDTATLSVKGPLSSARYHNNGGVGNQSYGYVGGNGSVSGSKIDRIDYSNDSATAVEKGNLSVNGGVKAATGNASYGYWGGGYPLKSTVSRLDYSNDSANTVDKGPLTVATIQLGAFGDTSYGYWAGGHPGPYTTVSRLDYSDDTTTTVSKGPLVQGVREHSGNSSRGNANAGAPSTNFIPRIRWVDSAAEASAVAGGPAYGYAMGGPAVSPSCTTTVQRIDYGNDTATAVLKGPLSVVRRNQGAAGNKSYGYNAGGHDASFNIYSTTERIDYENDTATAAPKGALPEARAVAGATSNDDYGWFGGGNPAPNQSIVNRIDFANDTATASPRGPLRSGKSSMGSAGNASYGYFTGGADPLAVSSVDRIDYSNDMATASPKGPLSGVREGMASFGNMNYGYFAGGYPSGPYSTVDRIEYANDTATASTKGPLNEAKRFSEGTASASGYGYAIGGYPGSVPQTSSISRVEFANDTATALSKGTLSAARAYYATVSGQNGGITLPVAGNLAPVQPPFPVPFVLQNPLPFGYFAGGTASSLVGGYTSTVDRVDYTNDTSTASPKGSLSGTRSYLGNGTGSISFGYIAGGNSPSTVSTIDRISYSNDTAAALARGPLSYTTNKIAGTGNINFGYFGGGDGPRNSVSKVIFASDTGTAATKGTLAAARYAHGATGNQSFGYFGAGRTDGATAITKVDRIDYSNDTSTASPKGNLTAGRSYLGATGNGSFGYFGGGMPAPSSTPMSSIDRVDYSNDTATASSKGPLNSAELRTTATGNQNFGYWGGAGSAPSTYSSEVQRLQYATDTLTASPKGPLTDARGNLGSMGAQANANPVVQIISAPVVPIANNGYWAAGNTNNSPYRYSLVERIDFSNDTATATPRGNLYAVRYNGGGTGNTFFGYHGGGRNSGTSPSAISAMDRVEYANDLDTAAPKGPLSIARWMVAAMGNASYGYWAGGRSPSAVSTVDRVDFSNDTPTTSPKGPLTIARAVSSGGTGNQSYGYVGGGDNPTRSIIERIDYSSDTSTATVVATTGFPGNSNRGMAATGNASYGYWGGGDYHPNEVTYIRRLDYSSDTTNASPKGNLTAGRYKFSATGTDSYGYWGAGAYDTPSGFTTIDRLDYSNDTATAVTKGPLAIGRWGTTSTSAKEGGLPN